ncbi:hypothetical protein FQN60_000801 [Etheostoma spectabile]|uniref:Calponin-homology (CH) domain-containing protein n=1 Tax=Etheostoma spectabile TaxID=54343 RepID=A0A5J5D334_9PERO|nr:hypothetical protein FQN60_000801 [Etheostoma spectabile]
MIASLSRGSLLDEVLHGGFNEQQLAAYVSWVNSQLKRKPGLKPITNLRHDLQDGVVLTQLIEIVAGEVLEKVHVAPQTKEESRNNVEQVLQFISSRHIRMPHISARDIVEGNLKSIMRIILALAAHFKPSANHRAASISGRGLSTNPASHNPLSTVALAQSAAVALASARLDASQATCTTRIHSGWGLDVEKNVCVRALVEQYERGATDEPEKTQPSSFSSVSPLSSPRAPPSTHSDRPQEGHQQHDSSAEPSHVVVETALEDSFSETLEKEVQDTRKMVSALQALLLRGSLPEDEQDVSLSLDQGNAEQQLVVVIRSRLDQSMEESQELKRELLRCKQEMRNLQGVKDAQQQRLCTQEASILQMKQELLRASMTKEELNNQNSELQWKLEECNRLWGECKHLFVEFVLNDEPRLLSLAGWVQKEIGQKDRLLQQLKHKLEESQKKQSELQRELEHKNSMQAEEVQLLRDSLRSLRNNFRDHDPQHHTLDTLEQGIVSLIDRLHVLHAHRGIPMEELGEVTLKDVKAAVDREGNYRYHFKALDPEFGTVKEEVFLDGAIIPGWEGKIVAWVEEDYGEDRPL